MQGQAAIEPSAEKEAQEIDWRILENTDRMQGIIPRSLREGMV